MQRRKNVEKKMMNGPTIRALVQALGGADNIRRIDAYASRVRVSILSQKHVNEDALRVDGILAVFRSGTHVHLICVDHAPVLAQHLSQTSADPTLSIPNA